MGIDNAARAVRRAGGDPLCPMYGRGREGGAGPGHGGRTLHTQHCPNSGSDGTRPCCRTMERVSLVYVKRDLSPSRAAGAVRRRSPGPYRGPLLGRQQCHIASPGPRPHTASVPPVPLPPALETPIIAPRALRDHPEAAPAHVDRGRAGGRGADRGVLVGPNQSDGHSVKPRATVVAVCSLRGKPRPHDRPASPGRSYWDHEIPHWSLAVGAGTSR